jgi:cytochrome b6-f complex iron-sulfur subunit
LILLLILKLSNQDTAMKKSNLPTSGTLSESRRKFIEKAGLSAVIGAFGVSFFTSCSTSDEEDVNPTNTNTGGNSSANGITVSGSTVVVDLALQTRLATAGGWLLIGNANTLVANINGAYVALTSVCTHSNCADSWSFTNSRFTCTCHGSVFDSSGSVIQGPANSPLKQFATSLAANKLTITK